VLPPQTIAHTTVRQETAALRDFDPANVGLGSDAVEKPVDDLTKVFQSSILGVFLLVKRSVQLPWLDTIDAQATHATGMFSSGRQI
jgi:hypothetical protein